MIDPLSPGQNPGPNLDPTNESSSAPAPNPRIEQLKAFLRGDPDDAQARFLLGYEYNKLKRPAEAVEVLLRCVEIRPDYAAAWKQLGDAYKRLDLPSEALRAYERGADSARAAANDHTARECETLAARLRQKHEP